MAHLARLGTVRSAPWFFPSWTILGWTILGSIAAGALRAQMPTGLAPALDDNLLVNGGFEAPNRDVNYGTTCPAIVGRLPAGWSDNSCWGGNTTAQIGYQADTTSPRAGAQCARIDVGRGIVQLVQSVELRSGMLYEASVWLRASAPIELALVLRQSDAPYTDFVIRTLTPTPTWQRYEVSGYAPTASALFMLRANVPAGGSSPVSIQVDDASLVERRPAPRGLPLADLPIPREFFGMHFHSPAVPWPSALPNLGAVRIWDADDAVPSAPCAQWACVNPAPGVFTWAALDAHVARARANGADVILTLGRTPRWASARPEEPSPYGPGQAAEPASDQAWQAWVAAVGQRYRGQVRLYEVWNEPNDAQFYTGTVARLVSLAAQANSILKAIDPANRLITPCPYDTAYLARYLAAGGGAHADIVGFHFYIASELAPEFLYESFVPNVRLTMQQHGVGALPLWNTESGWFAGPPFPTDRGVGYLSRALLLAWAAGVQRFMFYSWDERPTAGVILAAPPSYTTLTPAGRAYGELSAWLVAAKMRSLTRNGSAWVLELERGGAAAHVVWDPAGPATFRAPASASRVRRLDGTSATIGGGATVPIGEVPLLIE